MTASVLPVSSGPEDRGPLWDGPFLETVPGLRCHPPPSDPGLPRAPPCRTYQLDGSIKARGHSSCSGQLAEVRGPPNKERLL